MENRIGLGLSQEQTRYTAFMESRESPRVEKKPPSTFEQLEQENQRLRRENETLRQEREILKKATAFLARESK